MPFSRKSELAASAVFSRPAYVGLLLVLVSPPVFAQEVPLWVVVGVVSPALAFMLVAALALVARDRGKPVFTRSYWFCG